MSVPDKKRFIVRKFIMARNAREALTLDKRTPVDEVFVDEIWLTEHDKQSMGFNKNKKK